MITGGHVGILRRPCLSCGKPTRDGSRCAGCAPPRAPDTRSSRQSRGYDREYERNRATMISLAWRYRWECVICGKGFARKQDITAEHVIPLRGGGTSALSNLAPAHLRCNSGWKKRRAPASGTPA